MGFGTEGQIKHITLHYKCNCKNQIKYQMNEPLLSLDSQISFFKKGIELVSKKMDNFLSSVSNMTQR